MFLNRREHTIDSLATRHRLFLDRQSCSLPPRKPLAQNIQIGISTLGCQPGSLGALPSGKPVAVKNDLVRNGVLQQSRIVGQII